MQHRLRKINSTERTNRTAHECQHQSFAQEKIPHLLRREAEREQCADFWRALFEAELKQHRHQQQRRCDNEKTEAEKQSTEVLRFFRRLESLFTHWLEAQTQFLRFKIGENLFLQCGAKFVNRVGCVCRNRKPNRSQITEAIAPHHLTSGECDEGFGRAAILLPILLVLIANLVSERKARVPIARALGFLNAGKIRHQRAIRPRQFHRHDTVNTECISRLSQLRPGLRQKITQRNLVARLHPQIICEPLTDNDFVIAQTLRRPRRTRSGDHRVRRGV